MEIPSEYTGFIMETRQGGGICARMFREGAELGNFESAGELASTYAAQFLECARVSQLEASTDSPSGLDEDRGVIVVPSKLRIAPSRSLGCLELTMNFGKAQLGTLIGHATMMQLCQAIVSLCAYDERAGSLGAKIS